MSDIDKKLKPLGIFYTLAGKEMPRVKILSGEALPEPYKRLLYHHNDMTPTLSQFYNDRICLRVIASETIDNLYLRKVVLMSAIRNVPVEFGAIAIHLDRLNETTVEAVMNGSVPLGTILHNSKIDHSSSPNLFFTIEIDDWIAKALETDIGNTLYGRCNTLSDSDEMPIANIVEILPAI